MANKIIKDGKVAVIVSHGFGAGWSTWNTEYPDCDTNAELVQCILDGGDREAVAKKLYPESYTGGLDDAEIEWVQVGCQYRIDEYDGSEIIEFNDSANWKVA